MGWQLHHLDHMQITYTTFHTNYDGGTWTFNLYLPDTKPTVSLKAGGVRKVSTKSRLLNTIDMAAITPSAPLHVAVFPWVRQQQPPGSAEMIWMKARHKQILTTKRELTFCRICFSLSAIASPLRFFIRFFSSFLHAYILPVARTWHAHTSPKPPLPRTRYMRNVYLVTGWLLMTTQSTRHD